MPRAQRTGFIRIMFTALALAIRQLPEPEMRRPLFLSILWSLAALVLLWIGIGWAVSRGLAGIAWAQWVVGVFGAFAVPVLSYILFPSVVFLVLGLFSDAIILAVERRYYPYLPPAPGTPVLTALLSGLRLMLVGIVVNLVALAFVYWWAAWIPGLNIVVFGLINGYLVGRQYFETVAFRRFGTGAANVVWRDHRMDFILAGATVAALSLVPVVNLVAPMVGTAATVHLIERFRQSFAVPARA
ncbi:MAG: EI24 domain-containing protein [Aliidongia sp.]